MFTQCGRRSNKDLTTLVGLYLRLERNHSKQTVKVLTDHTKASVPWPVKVKGANFELANPERAQVDVLQHLYELQAIKNICTKQGECQIR